LEPGLIQGFAPVAESVVVLAERLVPAGRGVDVGEEESFLGGLPWGSGRSGEQVAGGSDDATPS